MAREKQGNGTGVEERGKEEAEKENEGAHTGSTTKRKASRCDTDKRMARESLPWQARGGPTFWISDDERTRGEQPTAWAAIATSDARITSVPW